MAESRLCGDCLRPPAAQLTPKTCDACLARVCPRCRPAHKIPRKCALLEARRKLRLLKPSDVDKAMILEKGEEWNDALIHMQEVERDFLDSCEKMAELMETSRQKVRAAMNVAMDRTDVLTGPEIHDIDGLCFSSLFHIRDDDEGYLQGTEHLIRTRLDIMQNLLGRLSEDPEEKLNEVVDASEKLKRALSAFIVRVDSIGTQTKPEEYSQLLKSEDNVHTLPAQVEEKRPEVVAIENDRSGRRTCIMRALFVAVPFLLLCLMILPLCIMNDVTCEIDILTWGVQPSVFIASGRLEEKLPSNLGRRKQLELELENITTNIDPNQTCNEYKPDDLSANQANPKNSSTLIMYEMREYNNDSKTGANIEDMHANIHAQKNDDFHSSRNPREDAAIEGRWIHNVFALLLVTTLSLPNIIFIMKRSLTATQNIDTQTIAVVEDIDTQTPMMLVQNQYTETTKMLTKDMGTETAPGLYDVMGVTSVMDMRNYAADLSVISDVAACPLTGRVFVCGKRGVHRAVILSFDQTLTVLLGHFITNAYVTDQSIAFISVSPAGELLFTNLSSTEIHFMSGEDGTLLGRLKTESRCGRCIRQDHEIYVCHPDYPCVSVLNDDGVVSRRIGKTSLRFPMYLAMDTTSRQLCVPDAGTNDINVFTMTGDLVRRFGGVDDMTEFCPCSAYVDSEGHMILSDRGRHKACIRVCHKDGTLIQTLNDERINSPRGLTLAGEDTIVLVNTRPPLLYVFRPKVDVKYASKR